jgi:RNA polymerase sigma factor (sigma-70 family)
MQHSLPYPHHIIVCPNNRCNGVSKNNAYPTIMDANIKEIVAGCRRGSSAAQRQLFERYQSRLFGVCLRYARDRSEAQDMLQDAFLSIFRDLGQYNGQGSFEGWMHRVTVRAALMQLRKRNPLRFAEDYSDLPPESNVAMPDADLNSEAILKCVQQLPTGYRTIFNMHCVEAWSYAEIAQELGIAESSVRSQYTRACAQLRTLVNDLFLVTSRA